MQYEFTPESFAQFRDDIMAANGDQATLSLAIADMQDVFINGMGSVKSSTEAAQAAEAECARLRSVNSQLLLKVGENIPQAQQAAPEEEKPKFDSVESYMHNWLEKHPKGW